MPWGILSKRETARLVLGQQFRRIVKYDLESLLLHKTSFLLKAVQVWTLYQRYLEESPTVVSFNKQLKKWLNNNQNCEH